VSASAPTFPFVRQTLAPSQVRALEPAAARLGAPDVWLHRYDHPEAGWRLSVATCAAPGSGALSLGGFRIAPEARAALPGYSNDREAAGLALGMEGKVGWSRALGVAGPRGRLALGRVVGGKCVLLPTPEARVGGPRDAELLDWAAACLADCDGAAGIHVVTGQDLGHGAMRGGASSLAYLHARFAGAVLADTSRPTAEGVFQLLCGMLEGAGVPPAGARVLLVGAGNIGRHLLARLEALGPLGGRVGAVEASPEARAALAARGVRVWGGDERLAALAEPWDAVAVNAAGGSLDAAACAAIAANAAVRVVCGAENLAMPDPAGERTLLAGGTLYAPTELGGMMGYLTAVEEYLAGRAGEPFDVGPLLAAAERLRHVGARAARRVAAGGHAELFRDAM
jgi:hypothetical protein